MSNAKFSVVQVGGFRPTLHPFSTNFGMKPLALAGEGWPESGGKPLLYVCQLNLTHAPAIPPRLADVKLITFFVEPETASLSEVTAATGSCAPTGRSKVSRRSTSSRRAKNPQRLRVPLGGNLGCEGRTH